MDANVSKPRNLNPLRVDPSYQLGTFRDNDDSLRRLKRQASIISDLELQCLVRAGLSTGARVLDVGCGPGIVAAAIANHAQPKRLVAGDVNTVSVDETRQLFEKQGIRNAEVRQINIYDEDLDAVGEFDFAYARLLFQHLSEPMLALLNLRQCLATDGRVCICDIDDQWLAVHPDVNAFGRFIKRAGEAQRSRGGDRNIGSKLAGYLLAAGYTDIRTETLLVSTSLISKQAFCDLVFGYKLEVIPAAELNHATRDLEAIKQSIGASDGWGGVAVFFVSGRKGPASRSR
jgi:SAM-dependent methyltransferase